MGWYVGYRPVALSARIDDGASPNLASLFAHSGELGAEVRPRRYIMVDDVFRVISTGDTADSALEAAKGAPVSANDAFQVTASVASGSGAAEVAYLGQAVLKS